MCEESCRRCGRTLRSLPQRRRRSETGPPESLASLIAPLAITCWVAGEYPEARDHLERALAPCSNPRRDNDLAFRFGLDPGVAAMFSLAAALCQPLGEVNRAVSLVEQMLTQIADAATHVGTLAVGRTYATLFAIDARSTERAKPRPNAFELVRLARDVTS